MVLRSTKIYGSQTKAVKVISSFKARVVKAGKELESFTVEAKHQHEAWSLACLKYMKEHPESDLEDVNILITE